MIIIGKVNHLRFIPAHGPKAHCAAPCGMHTSIQEGNDRLFVVLFALWLLFNGRVTWEIVLFGLGVSALCYGAACALFGFSIRRDLYYAKKALGMLKLLALLIWEIIKANVATIRVIYGKKQPEPMFVSFDAPVHTDAAAAALADCITLTPGTITADIADGKFTVHCLDRSYADGIDGGVLVDALQALEGGDKAQ